MPNYSKTCVSGWRLLQEYGCEITEIPFERDYTREELKQIIEPFHGVIADSEPWCEDTLAQQKIFSNCPFWYWNGQCGCRSSQAASCDCDELSWTDANTVAEQAVALLLAALGKFQCWLENQAG